ncbi:MAG: nucleoside-diphosphate kinase [Planctomycetota bacterium]|jgi:nucleoside diphosphate kinase
MAAHRKDDEELAYALITPYSLHKSRTGGIIARLLWANVKLVAARMYAPRPDSDFLREYCDVIYDPQERYIDLGYQKLIIEYILRNFGQPNPRGISNRLTVFLFRGPNAVKEIAEAAGHISQDVHGDTVRGTFGDFFREESESLQRDPAYRARVELLDHYEKLRRAEMRAPQNEFFEPAVLTGVAPEMNEAHLRIFRKYAYSDGGLVLDAVRGLDSPQTETSMVVLKPESLRNRNPLPGNLIDFFARAGMFITGMKVLELSVEEARQFYARKIPQFCEQLKGMVAVKAGEIVEQARLLARQAVDQLGADPAVALRPANALAAARQVQGLFSPEPAPGEVKPPVLERILEELAARLDDLQPPDHVYKEIAEELKEINARAEFGELIRYMTGKDPATGKPLAEGEESRCMAILYSGPGALSVIRKRLKELREVYGQNVLQNRAHASDPEEDPVAEMAVFGMPAAPQGESRPCDVERVVDELYSPPG